jgi:hypothetical protein
MCSWAGLSPGNNESAGKRKSERTRKGNKKLRSALVKARAAGHTKNTYLSSQYHRLAARRGKSRAAVAVAHSILTISYYIIKRKQPYIELGSTYYEERKRDTALKQSINKLESLGYKVTVESVA